jgi:hypothetical protein
MSWCSIGSVCSVTGGSTLAGLEVLHIQHWKGQCVSVATGQSLSLIAFANECWGLSKLAHILWHSLSTRPTKLLEHIQGCWIRSVQASTAPCELHRSRVPPCCLNLDLKTENLTSILQFGFWMQNWQTVSRRLQQLKHLLDPLEPQSVCKLPCM